MAVNGMDIVNYLLQFKGTPYEWGGNQPGGFDCSGLMEYGFKHFGITIPRVTYDQIGVGQAIGMGGLRPGDLVFFDTNKKISGPDHVGIYMGDGKMFHTPRPGKSAEIVDLTTGYYADAFMGGRRINGVVAVGGSAADFGDEKIQKQLTPEELAANYGWNIAFLNSIPEVKKIFDQAIKETWTAQKFQATLRDTNWFKTTSENARKAAVMETTDPATWNATLDATVIKLKQLAGKIGAAIPDGQYQNIAKSVIRSGMSDDGITYMLADYIKFTQDGTAKGEAGMHQYNIKKYAAEMGVKLSDEAIANQAAMIVKKVATMQDFQSQIREMAKSAFPGYGDQLDAGVTVKDISGPYIQTMAKELNIPPDSITLDDPQVRMALNGLNADGKPTGLPLYKFQNQLRNDPRWNKTQHTQDMVMSVGNQVLKDMGLKG